MRAEMASHSTWGEKRGVAVRDGENVIAVSKWCFGALSPPRGTRDLRMGALRADEGAALARRGEHHDDLSKGAHLLPSRRAPTD